VCVCVCVCAWGHELDISVILARCLPSLVPTSHTHTQTQTHTHRNTRTHTTHSDTTHTDTQTHTHYMYICIYVYTGTEILGNIIEFARHLECLLDRNLWPKTLKSQGPSTFNIERQCLSEYCTRYVCMYYSRQSASGVCAAFTLIGSFSEKEKESKLNTAFLN
jgi:hypothetical protein